MAINPDLPAFSAGGGVAVRAWIATTIAAGFLDSPPGFVIDPNDVPAEQAASLASASVFVADAIIDALNG